MNYSHQTVCQILRIYSSYDWKLVPLKQHFISLIPQLLVTTILPFYSLFLCIWLCPFLFSMYKQYHAVFIFRPYPYTLTSPFVYHCIIIWIFKILPSRSLFTQTISIVTPKFIEFLISSFYTWAKWDSKIKW